MTATNKKAENKLDDILKKKKECISNISEETNIKEQELRTCKER